ncbi:MAG: 30S ribosomal protein S20 [Gemmatimonadota bacterium]|nr:30S ribosomal protein S20 [Gemmatimonadota bacterium]
MPHSRSAKKRMRQSEKRRTRNRTQRSEMRSLVKQVQIAATKEDGETAFRKAEQLIDRAARKRLVHPNTAARTKSRLKKAVLKKD